MNAQSTLSAPVAMFTFANEQNGQSYLRNLPVEYQDLVAIFSAKIQSGQNLELVHRTNSTYRILLDLLQQQYHQERIVFFHFGGHAGNEGLQVEEDGAGSAKMSPEAIVSALSVHKNTLKFVFLNACHTQEIGRALLDAGIPVVIGTSSSVSDQVAIQLAVRFYKGISENLSVQQAWDQASLEVQDLKTGQLRKASGVESDEDEETLLSWVLMDQGNEAAKAALSWTLSQSTADLLLGLPPLPKDISLPAVPFQFLQSYGRDQARIFWGRNQPIRDFFKLINDESSNSVLLLHGLSGVGKSSFLNAGVMPRFAENQIFCLDIKKTAKKPWALLCEVFGLSAEVDAAQLGENWQQWEAKTTKPLFIMIDQFEEIAHPGFLHELDIFFAKIRTAFAPRPMGKLILSFRKEYLAEIMNACETADLHFTHFVLGPLSATSIKEVVNGVSSSPSLKNHFKVEHEPGLDAALAQLLLNNPDLPLAPVLQIVMSNLWERSGTTRTAKRIFSLEILNGLSREGLGMDKFLGVQLQKVAETHPAEVATGLAIDVLHFHTSLLGNCQNHTQVQTEAYYGRSLDLLLKKLCEAYLLVELDGEPLAFTLAHDTLGPVVQQYFNASTTPGQQANRLAQSLNIAAKHEAFQQNPDSFLLNEDQILTLEKGKEGMRKLSKDEEALLLQSRTALELAQQKKRRNTLFLYTLASALGLFLLAFMLVLIQSNRNSKANALMYQATALENEDPTQARNLYQKSIKLHSTAQAWKNLYGLQRREVFYTQLQAPIGKDINAGAIGGRGKQVAYCVPVESGYQIKLFQLEQDRSKLLETLEVGSQISNLSFASTSNRLLGAGLDHILHWWSMAGYDEPLNVQDPLKGVAHMAISPDEKWVVLAEENKDSIKVFSTDQRRMKYTFHLDVQANAAIQSLAIVAGGGTCLIALKSGQILRYDQQLQKITIWKSNVPSIQHLQWSASGKWLLVLGKKLELWSSESIFHPTARPLQVFQLSTLGLKATLDSTEQRLLLCDAKGDASLYEIATQQKLFTLRSKEGGIIAAEFGAKDQSIITLNSQGAIWSWAMPAIAPVYQGPSRALGLLNAQGDQAVFAVDDTLFWADFPKLSNVHKEVIPGFLIQSMASDPSGKILLLGANDGRVAWYHTGKANQPEYLLPEANGSLVLHCAVSTKGKLGISADDQGSLAFWNVEKNKLIKRVQPFEGGIAALAFDPQDETLFLLSHNSEVQIWNANTVEKKAQLSLKSDEYRSICILPGKKQFYLGSGNGKIYHYNTRGQCLDSLDQNAGVVGMAFAPHQHLLLSVTEEGRINFWDLNQKQIFQHLGSQGRVSSLQMTTDGQWILALPALGGEEFPKIWWNNGVRKPWVID
ncbi:CHAT domain-containing protein [Haliscomenobacter hydrossis]|nr:CHAT domain-containing protein [Haliscomenobacter hydrossis]